MTNRDEDDEEEERPEELDDQLDLRKRRTWELLQCIKSFFLAELINYYTPFYEVKICPPCSSYGM